MIDINKLGSIKYQKKKNLVKIKISDIKDGLNIRENYFIYKKKDNYQIYDRVCDHRGGKLINKDNEIKCPIHNWVFNPITGKYSNGVKKTSISYIKKEDHLEFFNFNFEPCIKKRNIFKEDEIKLRFFNHAFLKFSTKNISFCTDPWAIGPAFYNGWWLKKETDADWIKELNKSDFIFISHNHPDHLHQLTLSKLNKNKTILIPKFTSNSTYLFLKEEGFKNIIKLEFEKQYSFKSSNLVIVLFKSGDFREDSGIYFSLNNFSALLDIDAGSINFNKFPKVDLYGSSFAGGASGFPTMFENYSENQKKKIIELDRKFIISKKIRNLKLNSAKYFLPYAGFFQEKLKRDNYVFKMNKKNKISDYEKFYSNKNIQILNVEKNNFFVFKSNNLVSEKKLKKKSFKDATKLQYLNDFKKQNSKIDFRLIENYFLKSGFNDNLILIISLTDDLFKNNSLQFYVVFGNKINVKKINKISEVIKNKQKKILHLKIRKEAFINCIRNGKSWEDLLIGFQVKVSRDPNIFNSEFWHYFSNNYVSKKRVKSLSKCNGCEVITQKLYSEII